MSDTKAKRDELQRVHLRANAILEAHKQGLTAEQDLEVATLLRRAGELKTEIETEMALEAKAAELKDIDKFLNDPVHRVPHGVNGDDDDRKSLLKAGWEIKGGMVCAPTSRGEPFPMYAEDVLFGTIPTDDEDAARYYRKTRAIFDPEYKQAYTKHFRAMAMYQSDSVAMNRLTASEQKALSEGLDTGGGFLVPPDVQAELLSRTAQRGIVRGLARVQTTSRDVLRFPRLEANTTSAALGSIYSSGFVGGWVGETPAFSETDPAFGTFDIAIKKLRVATKLSNDLIADAAVNVLSLLATNGAENMALVEDAGFLTGDGAALQPLGLLNSGITTFDVEGSTTDTISNTTSAAGSVPKIVAGYYLLPPQYVGNASWVMNRAIEGKVRALVDGIGRPTWPPLVGSGFALGGPELLGARVYNSPFMPTDGTNANKVLLLGDFSAYVIAQRAQVTSMVLRERFADTDQTAIILFERVGGATWNVDAFRVGVV